MWGMTPIQEIVWICLTQGLWIPRKYLVLPYKMRPVLAGLLLTTETMITELKEDEEEKEIEGSIH